MLATNRDEKNCDFFKSAYSRLKDIIWIDETILCIVACTVIRVKKQNRAVQNCLSADRVTGAIFCEGIVAVTRNRRVFSRQRRARNGFGVLRTLGDITVNKSTK